MKNSNKTLLIGLLFGVIFFCIFRDNSFKEGLTKRAKDKIEEDERKKQLGPRIKSVVTGAATSVATTAAGGAIGTAATLGKVMNVGTVMSNAFKVEAGGGSSGGNSSSSGGGSSGSGRRERFRGRRSGFRGRRERFRGGRRRSGFRGRK
jgi:hypothetical protein